MKSRRVPIKKLLKSRTSVNLKLDIGCGENKQDGHIGMDYKPFKGVDVVHDSRKFPWPFADKTFTLLSASQVLQYIPREDGVFIDFMNECWRILKDGGQFRIAVPFAGSTAYWSDPMNINGIVPQTFHYFDPLAPLNAYRIYKPKPWKIEALYWAPDGNIECLLSKRREDPSYGKR